MNWTMPITRFHINHLEKRWSEQAKYGVNYTSYTIDQDFVMFI